VRWGSSKRIPTEPYAGGFVGEGDGVAMG